MVIPPVPGLDNPFREEIFPNIQPASSDATWSHFHLSYQRTRFVIPLWNLILGLPVMLQGGILSWARGRKDRRWNPDRVTVVAFPSQVPGTQRTFQTPLPAPVCTSHLWGFMGPAVFPLRRLRWSKSNYFVLVFFSEIHLCLEFCNCVSSLSLFSNEVLEDEALLAWDEGPPNEKYRAMAANLISSHTFTHRWKDFWKEKIYSRWINYFIF